MQLLITATDIRAVRDLSLQIKDSKINPIISDAQISDLRPLLGDALFYDILAKSTLPDPNLYTDLLNGCDYVINDITYHQFGVKRLLIELAYVRYMFDSTDISTPFGVIDKKFNDGTTMSRDRSKELSNLRKKTANDFWLGVEHYLYNNTETYTLFKKFRDNEIMNTFKFSNITRDGFI